MSVTPAELVPRLGPFVDGVRGALGDRLLGLYLVGSFALGAADEHSDVDVVAVTDGSPDEQAQAALRTLHARLPDEPSRWLRHLEVGYAPAADLRGPMTLGRAWLHVDDGGRVLERSPRDNTAHTRWVLREHGVVLVGPDPASLVAAVSADALRAEALGSARARAEWLEEEPERYADAGFQAACVLTSCRILLTAVEGRVASGPEAATWALDHLPAVHHDLVRAALDRRAAARSAAGRAAPAADPEHARRTRALVWDVVTLAGTAALEARDG